MNKTLIFFTCLAVAGSAYSDNDFFEKKPSILIAKDEAILKKNNGNEHVDFFELSNQLKIKWANQNYNYMTHRSKDLFQTSGMSAYDKAQYTAQNKSLDNKVYSKLIETKTDKRVISQEEYQQQMEQRRKREIDDRDLLYLLDK
ncbi:hypothetical protein AAV96_03195 [Acinetobacter sp. AG1]|uniref:hypothetical protein n=1 Tax=Acinetobacter TaxID=469 RepID=UPI000629213F|nr:hypothetical protein [Acinetobacter sp. AG1]KKW81530.1 hypothetical protein AAV96_03195 [Acinetobacter sp. AG1]